jgi:acetyl esterase/lipase
MRKSEVCLLLLLALPLPRAHALNYGTEKDITYCTVDGKELKLNAFLPVGVKHATPAMVEIHGGWWTTGGKSETVQRKEFELLIAKRLAIFSIDYRLGREGGFPECIRDCRNAIRFLRQNAERFNINPDHIGCFGGSAGGHLSLMLAVAPEDFDDGGPVPELKGVSAKVCGAFAWCSSTNFIRQWDEAEAHTPHDARHYLKALFHGAEPDTEEHRQLYFRMSPINYIGRDVAPLLLCDGEYDPVVPHLHGQALYEKLRAAGADATYWLTLKGAHLYPSGPGFEKVLDGFLNRALDLGE